MNAPARVGWCPGALRPMASGDGLILRVKPRGGGLSVAQARRIAEVSRRHGNGALDLTSHANLQIRGLTEATHGDALAALGEAGLIDSDPAAEAVRNVMASPLAGLDPQAVLDVRPLVEALERRLTEDRTLHRLPAKFCVAVDDGGMFRLDDVPADIRFEALMGEDMPLFAIRLGDHDAVEGLCHAIDLVETAARLSLVMIAANAADPDNRRMRHLVRRDGAATIMARAALGTDSASPRPSTTERGDGRYAGTPSRGECRSHRAGGALQKPTTVLPQDRGTVGGTACAVVGEVHSTCLGIAAPFGRLDAGQFETVARAARDAGVAELRLTPWRAILLPGLREADAARVAAICQGAGLIVDPADPRLSIAACPGAPGCHRGSTPVHGDAERLSRHVASPVGPERIALHVSGCGKGCAHAGQAPLTLVAQDGRYDMVIDGRASDEPALRGLTIDDVERCLDASARGEPWS